MEEQRLVDQVKEQYPKEWAVFEVTCSIEQIEKICTADVGPRTFWLHSIVGGPGWQVFNAQGTEKVILMADQKLATYIKLKLS